ncbi:tRNA guanosine(34) transglycosylase Tgt, partial [Dehalogenimonas etheniformans]
DEDGVSFRSHLDGSKHRLNPEISIRIQEQLGADMILAFDECTSPMASYEYTAQALERTHRWAVRCLEARRDTPQALYGIVQGGEWQDLRERSVEFIGSLPFQGLAIGGSLGKSKQDMHRVLDWTVPGLPSDRPRHLLGIGEVDDLFECVERGIDTFDCVIPTRFARTANLFVPFGTEGASKRGTLVLRHTIHARDQRPVDPDCECYCCRNFSRAYLRHLFKADEILAYVLGTIHNLHFMLKLMRTIRASLDDGTFPELKARWLSRRDPEPA